MTGRIAALIFGLGAMLAGLANSKTPPPAQERSATALLPDAPLTAPAPPRETMHPSDALACSDKVLGLVHTGAFRSRDVHSRALYLLALIPNSAPEDLPARTRERQIAGAYKAGAPPTPEQGPLLRLDTREIVSGPCLEGSNPPELLASSFPRTTVAATNVQPAASTSMVPRYTGSNTTSGASRTVWVQPYTKKDGTHVRGHYRSPPSN